MRLFTNLRRFIELFRGIISKIFSGTETSAQQLLL